MFIRNIIRVVYSSETKVSTPVTHLVYDEFRPVTLLLLTLGLRVRRTLRSSLLVPTYPYLSMSSYSVLKVRQTKLCYLLNSIG